LSDHAPTVGNLTCPPRPPTTPIEEAHMDTLVPFLVWTAFILCVFALAAWIGDTFFLREDDEDDSS